MSDDEVNAVLVTAAGNEEEDEMAAMLDLSKKKKKKKKKDKKEEDEEQPEEEGGGAAGLDSSFSGASTLHQQRNQQVLDERNQTPGDIPKDPYDRKAEYSYDELLDRIIKILHSNNPDLVEKKRRNMKPPQLTRVGTKKTLWVNFQEICTMMQRNPEHVFQFFMAELGTEGSIDGNQRLVIKGKYLPKYIESLLRKYIVEYVTCRMCRSPNTDLVKDSSTRLYFLKCRDCGSSRSVAAIRYGFHATSRADRRAARNAA
jgi:translation initiation factor 2 subunit 2